MVFGDFFFMASSILYCLFPNKDESNCYAELASFDSVGDIYPYLGVILLLDELNRKNFLSSCENLCKFITDLKDKIKKANEYDLVKLLLMLSALSKGL
jgi:hypothetical protein